MLMKNKRLALIMLVVFALLLIPFIAMQFTTEVKWSAPDFLVAGSLLFGTGLLCEYALRKITKRRHRIAVCAVILMGLLLIWAELAVGIFGTPLAGS
jgi:hypothetical protein